MMNAIRCSVVSRHFMGLTKSSSSWPSCSNFLKLKTNQSVAVSCSGWGAIYTSIRCSSHQTETVDSLGFLADLKAQGKYIDVTWKDSTSSRYYSLWLRKNCHCPACRHDNGQLLLPSFSLPASLTVKSTKVDPANGSGTLLIEWNEESHQTTLPLCWLKENSYSRPALQQASHKQDVTVFKGPIKEFNIQDITAVGDKVNRFFKDLNEDGVVLVKGVPIEKHQVCKVAEIIAPAQHTLYGKTFSVEAKEDAINVAYTPHALELHMDLVYYQSPPGLQLLHCLRFDEQVMGGESVFLDTIHVAQEMQWHHPDLFDTLTRVPATFQKFHFERETPAAFRYQRPHITVNREGKITSVIWSPPFEGPLKVPEEDVAPYFEAYRKFAELVNTSELQFSHRLQPGDCVIFNNLRILHARNAFTLNGGKRQLMGCYINIDAFKNRVQVAHIQSGSEEIAKRVNNGDYS
ncbi:uncharacterized protein LOC110979659 [Acanthaster planci]|uniref:Uncharacterized protein LOC110979659 n=1 Tax=Acanthaster planci TaxID=133434 RepID=A0A8B7YDL8_ACAPL|nr:uncharacterized protein LOC110979659 [Acanthaster planci]